MVWFYGYFLPHFNIVNTLEYGESMPDTENVHFFQLLMLKSYQCFPHNLVFCSARSAAETKHSESGRQTDELITVLGQGLAETRKEVGALSG